MPAHRTGGPGDGGVELVVPEALDLGLDEVPGQAGHPVGQFAVGGQRNPANAAMVVAHEADVPQQTPDVLPPGELAGVDDDARQRVVRFQPRVGGRGESVEVLGRNGSVTSTTRTPDSGRRRCETPGLSGSELSQAMASSRWSMPKTRRGKGNRNAMNWLHSRSQRMSVTTA